jgi:hypothetical protein
MRIPICPPPQPGETVSSWMERTACFFGCDYDHWISPILLELGEYENWQIDLDTSEPLRRLLSRQTGVPLSRIPALSSDGLLDLLPSTARLGFCSRCWNEDVANQLQPFVRQTWTLWSSVHCRVHGIFLSARYPNLDKRDPLIRWRGIWNTRRVWRSVFDFDSQADYSGDGWYTPVKSSRLPRAQHCRLLGILERFSRPDDITAAKAISVGLEVNSHAPDIQLSRTRIPRMTESSFSSSSNCKPFLLENRIAVLRLAAEVLCLMEGTEPIDLRRRRTLADLQAAVVSPLMRLCHDPRRYKSERRIFAGNS